MRKTDSITLNSLNSPKSIKEGQIWRSIEMEEDLLIVGSSKYSEGEVDALIIKRSEEPFEDHYPKLKIKSEIGSVLGRVNSVREFEQCKINVKNLTYFKGKVPKSYLEAVKRKYLQRLKSVRLTKLGKSGPNTDYHETQNNVAELESNYFKQKVTAWVVVKLLKWKAGRIRYAVLMDDGAIAREIQNFWRDERRSNSHKLFEEHNSNIRLSVVIGRLYLVSYSDSFKKLSSIQLLGNGTVIKAIDKELNFSKNNGRVFTSFEDTEKLTAGEWKVKLKIDGKSRSFSFMVE